MKLFIAILTTFFLASCGRKKKVSLSQDNLLVQSFDVDPAKDTILLTKEGCKISILKGTFEGAKVVNLEIKEALTLNDIVLAGLITASGGVPLQSGGMIFISGGKNNSDIKILKPIEISVPTKNYNPNMQLFRGVLEKNNSINWKNPNTLLNRQETNITERGELLFQQKCASCHSIDKNLTGPALAFVTERRCMNWLTEATKNPLSLIQTDDCFREQKKMFGGNMMPAFPDLSDNDIEAIYSYITKESEKYRGDEGAPWMYDPCHNLVINDTIGKFKETHINSTKIGFIKNSAEKNLNSNGIGPDTISTNNSVENKNKLPDEYYTFTINTFGWYNIDCYINSGGSVEVSILFVTIKDIEEKDLNVYLIIPSEKIFMNGHKNENGKYDFYDEEGKIPLPQNKTAYILALKNISEKPLIGKLKFTTSIHQDLDVNMQSGLDIEKEIKSMNLDSFEFEMDHVKTVEKLLINQRIYQFMCPEKKRDMADSTKK